MKIYVDSSLCVGHALCMFESPEVFVLDEQGYNKMGEFVVAPGQEESARAGMLACPEGAISIIEDEG